MARRMSENGRRKLSQWEANILYAYDDFDTSRPPKKVMPGMKVRGTLTIGKGHTGPDVRPGMTITPAQSDALFDRDLRPTEAVVDRLVKVETTTNQFDVLCSFVHNLGAGTFASSTLLKKLNKGQYDAVPVELMKFVNSKGKRMQGLVNRRAQEAALWGKGNFVASSFVSAETNVSHKDVATIGGSGAAGIAASIGPSVPDITDAVLNQQSELSSGDWLRITIGAVILALTIYGIYRRIKA